MYRIREVRSALKISQKELSDRAHVSRPYLVDLEHNRRGAKPETLQRIADALGVNVSVLTEREVG